MPIRHPEQHGRPYIAPLRRLRQTPTRALRRWFRGVTGGGRPGPARWLWRRLGALLDRSVPERELSVRWGENPIIVPSRRDVDEAIGRYFAVGDQLELARFGWASQQLDPDTSAEQLQRFHDEDLEPIRDQYKDAARVLIEALALGGPPPLRWNWQRWNRRREWMGWYLSEGRPARRRQCAGAAPWGQPGITDEPPF